MPSSRRSGLSVPKPFKSAKALYSASIYEKLKASNISAAANDIKLMLDKAWEELSPEIKNEWEERSEREEKLWISEMEEYQAATKSSDEEFTDSALRAVLDRCFIKGTLDELVDQCLNKDISAFTSLERTKAKSKRERLILLCSCRPDGCKNAANLFRYLVQVSDTY